MAEKTYDIRVAIEWGEWVDGRGVRHRVSAHPGPCGSFEWWSLIRSAWVTQTGPGLPPYRPVPRKPAPARLWECELDGRRIRRRGWLPGVTAFVSPVDGVFVYHEDEPVIPRVADLNATDWEHETEKDSGVFVSPNGWVSSAEQKEDDDG